MAGSVFSSRRIELQLRDGQQHQRGSDKLVLRRLVQRYSLTGSRPPRCPNVLFASLVGVIVAAGITQFLAPRAGAAPAPEVEYLYNVTARRHYNFPDNDALGYGHGICDKVSQSQSYAQVMSDVKREVTPSDEFAANYLVSYAVNLLCPAEIWQLRNSAAHYQPQADQP